VGSYPNDAVTLPSDTDRHWTELGTVSIPSGGDPRYDGYSNVEIPARGVCIIVTGQRVSGTGSLDFDCLLFVPAHDQLAVLNAPDLACWPRP
jgi:hypothetical protein